MVPVFSYVSHGEKLKRKESENNRHAALYVPNKYKPRRVSAIRDFPKGFEKFGTQISGSQNKDLASVGVAENCLGHNVDASTLENESIKPFEIDVVSKGSLVHSEIHEIPSNLKLEPMVKLEPTVAPEPFEDGVRSDVKQAIKYCMGDSDDDSVEPFQIDVVSPTQQVDTPSSLKISPNISSKMYISRREVSAVRCYPPGCGGNVTHLSREDCEKALASSKNKGLHLEKFDVKNEPLEETVRDDVKKVTKNSAGDSEADHIKPYENDAGCQAQQVDRPTNLKILPDTSSKICIPRRRVSAIRDFPPGCGTEFSNLSKEDWEKSLASSMNNGVNHKNPTLGNKPIDETGRKEANLKEIFPGNSVGKVQTECKDDNTEAVKKETQPTKSAKIKSERIDSNENCVNPMHGSKLHHSGIKSQTIIGKADGDDCGSAGKLRKELSNNIKDKNIKLSGASSSMNLVQGLQKPGHRVIVQALMAAPRCPWRQGKRAFKCNPGSGATGRK